MEIVDVFFGMGPTDIEFVCTVVILMNEGIKLVSVYVLVVGSFRAFVRAAYGLNDVIPGYGGMSSVRCVGKCVEEGPRDDYGPSHGRPIALGCFEQTPLGLLAVVSGLCPSTLYKYVPVANLSPYIQQVALVFFF